ncbi:MAG: tRNA 2-selenouridine(34) synthase MnmH, partial [Ignavibacteriae bacterium]
MLIDVRSPGEYDHGHIPGAVNIPLFTDHERAVVGTSYKQDSPEAAMDVALKIVGPKLYGYVEQVRLSTDDKRLTLYCWRGGMRSSSMAWLFRTVGYDVDVLPGGYKAYRRRVHEVLEYPWNFAVIGGRTGSGKTKVLKILHDAGEQVLDLEAIAHHKGSAFGALNQPPQPTT